MIKKIYQGGLIAYFLLIVIAAIFYLERTVFIDVSFLIFNILKNDALSIQVYRFGAAITQSIILLAGKAEVGLKHVALLYSVGVTGYYFICYLLCGFVFKNYRVGLVLLLFNILFVSDSFYWIQAELPQGTAFMLLVFAYITRPREGFRTIPEYLLIIAGCITMVFFHPLIFIMVLYFLLFLGLQEHREISRRILVFIAICTMICVAVKNIWFQSQYDEGAMSNTRGFLHLLPHYFSFSSTKNFIAGCLYKYYWIPITSCLIIFYYLKNKRFTQLLLFIAFTGGYILLINTSYRENVAQFYIENLYLPIGVFIGVPLVYDALPWLGKKKYLAAGLMGLIMLTGIVRIYTGSKPYATRLQWEKRFLSTHREQKWIIDKTKVPMDTLIMNWGSSYEFWLLSTIQHGKASSIMIADNADNYIVDANNRKTFITQFAGEEYDWLKPPYFIFTDTVSRYTIVK